VGVEADEKLLRAFGLAVRQAREQKGVSQDVLAELAGLHRTYIGSVERGERNLSLKNISAVASALGMSGSKLLERAEGFVGKRNSSGPGGRK
jgi:transcriptional regulator with XRE-family HTH domain